MKTRKLQGFGSLGSEIFDFHLATASQAQVLQVGQNNLDQLLTVVRRENVGRMTIDRFHQICSAWALEIPEGGYESVPLTEKYGPQWWHGTVPMSEEDKRIVEENHRMRKGVEHLKGMTRVTGMRDEKGNTTGMFADGELEWHSNNQGRKKGAPVVGLIGWQGVKGSRTEFLNTVDAFYALTPEWQKTCDELIAVHKWVPGVMAPGLNRIQDDILKMNMCPVDNTEVPVTWTSPGGLKGLHFAFTTIHHFKGMSEAESAKVVAFLKDHLIRDEFVYGHDWEDGDVLFFDNTITLHRRPTKDCSKRLLYRMAFNYDRLLRMREGAGVSVPAQPQAVRA